MSNLGKAMTSANKNSKNVLYHQTVTLYQLSFNETVEEIDLYNKKLLPGKSNIESYLKTICYHAEEEIMNGKYGDRARMKDEIYRTFNKNEFHNMPWWTQLKQVLRGDRSKDNVEANTIEQAINYYPIVKADPETDRSAHMIERFLTAIGVDYTQIPCEAAATVTSNLINPFDFHQFIIEATRAFERTGNIDVIIQKYGKEKVKDYYHMFREIETALVDKII